MKAVFGVVSLMIAVALVGLLAGRQVKALRQGMPAPTVSAAASGVPVPVPTVRDQSVQIQEQVRSDVAKALEQGAHRQEADTQEGGK